MSAGQSGSMGRSEPSMSGKSTRSPEEQNKALCRRSMQEIWGEGKMSTLDELYAPNYVDHTPAPGTTPNRDGVKQAYNVYHKAFPDFTFTIDDLLAEGDRVCARFTFHGTQRGELLGIPPTGKHVNVAGVEIVRISNGKITEGWEFLDQAALLQQLGVPQSR